MPSVEEKEKGERKQSGESKESEGGGGEKGGGVRGGETHLFLSSNKRGAEKKKKKLSQKKTISRLLRSLRRRGRRQVPERGRARREADPSRLRLGVRRGEAVRTVSFEVHEVFSIFLSFFVFFFGGGGGGFGFFSVIFRTLLLSLFSSSFPSSFLLPLPNTKNSIQREVGGPGQGRVQAGPRPRARRVGRDGAHRSRAAAAAAGGGWRTWRQLRQLRDVIFSGFLRLLFCNEM